MPLEAACRLACRGGEMICLVFSYLLAQDNAQKIAPR